MGKIVPLEGNININVASFMGMRSKEEKKSRSITQQLYNFIFRR
jgi:hypothetical protein